MEHIYKPPAFTVPSHSNTTTTPSSDAPMLRRYEALTLRPSNPLVISYKAFSCNGWCRFKKCTTKLHMDQIKAMTVSYKCARPADMKDVMSVTNYDFLGSLEDYVHRIGRTWRAGPRKLLSAYTFCTSAKARLVYLRNLLLSLWKSVRRSLSS